MSRSKEEQIVQDERVSSCTEKRATPEQRLEEYVRQNREEIRGAKHERRLDEEELGGLEFSGDRP